MALMIFQWRIDSAEGRDFQNRKKPDLASGKEGRAADFWFRCDLKDWDFARRKINDRRHHPSSGSYWRSASVCGLIEGEQHSRSRLLISTLDLVCTATDLKESAARVPTDRRLSFGKSEVFFGEITGEDFGGDDT
ncbi:hypothetical protein U1Q18_001541 [Sarracenia purpurea var. burkii]